MDDLIIFGLILLVSFISWVFKEGGLKDILTGKGRDKTDHGVEDDAYHQQSPEVEEHNRPAQGEAEQQRVRKFMEALGLPPDAVAPPPPIQPKRAPRQAVPPRTQPAARRAHTAPPPMPSHKPLIAPAGQEAAYDLPTRRAPQPETRLTKAEEEALRRLEVSGAAFPAAPVWAAREQRGPAGVSPAGLRGLLSSGDGLRGVIVAQEILGTPMGLRPLPGGPEDRF